MMKNISIRLNENLMKEAEKLARLELVDKSIILREALEKGLKYVKLHIAIEMFSRERFSTSEAAELAGISVGEMMDELVNRGIKPKINEQDIAGSLENALKVVN